MLGPNIVNLQYRGAGVFTSEAGLFGGLLVFMWLLVDYVKQAFNISNRHYFALLGMLVFMILQSKSGTGYIYLIFYFALKLVFSRMSMSMKFLILIFGLVGLFQILPLIWLNQLWRNHHSLPCFLEFFFWRWIQLGIFHHVCSWHECTKQDKRDRPKS